MNDASPARTERVHRDSIIIDGHCDTLGCVIEKERRLGERSALGQFDLPRALDGGLTAQLTATFFDTEWPGSAIYQTVQTIDAYYEELEAYADLAMPAVCADDVLRAKELGKVALILSMEGAEGLEGDLSILRIYYRLGMRVLGITWNRRNEAGDGAGEIRTGGGLSNFGVELIQECNRLGMLIDVAHLAPAGVKDVLEVSEAPVVSTHANAHGVWPHPRNLTDAQLESIASRGGVVGVNALPHHLGSEDEMHGPLSLILDHIDYMVSVMGEDGVGIGMDFDGMDERRTEGMEDVSKLPNLTKGLVERGYTDQAIGKILGGNFLRVFRQVM